MHAPSYSTETTKSQKQPATKFVQGAPALVLRDALVIADLHIGLENELQRTGVRLPSTTKRMLHEILMLIDKTKAKKLFILGDIKHRISQFSPQEKREIPDFLAALNDRVELRVVLGNHDAGLKPLLSSIKNYGSRGFIYYNTLLFHGHAQPFPDDAKNCSRMIMSHLHPAFEFRHGPAEKIWVEARAFGKPLLIMPSFNPMLLGVPLSKLTSTWIDFNGARITLLDGTYLGEFNVQASDNPTHRPQDGKRETRCTRQPRVHRSLFENR